MKMPFLSSDLSLILAALTVSGLSLSPHQARFRPSPNPTMSPPGPKRARCIYGMSGPSSSPSTYPATPATKPVQTPPYSRSHPTVAQRASQWTGLHPAMPIPRPSDCSPETSIQKFTLPQRAKPDLTPCHNLSPLTPHQWKTSSGALPNPPSSLPVQPINPSRYGMSG